MYPQHNIWVYTLENLKFSTREIYMLNIEKVDTENKKQVRRFVELHTVFMRTAHSGFRL